jgi:hypothetical protein
VIGVHGFRRFCRSVSYGRVDQAEQPYGTGSSGPTLEGALRRSTEGREMHVEGITWHAIVLEADEFAATKKLLVETFGLTPAIEQEGWALFPMPNGTILDLYAPGAIPAYGSTRASCSVSGSKTSKPPQPSSPPQDASSSAKSLASTK